MNRSNATLAAAVEIALAMASKSDALTYMTEHHVPNQVIVRLLGARAKVSNRRKPIVTELPPDQFNVLVENDMDEARLLWLVNRIGETKLRKTAAKY